MTRCTLTVALCSITAAFILPFSALAEKPAAPLDWAQFEDPDFVPSAEAGGQPTDAELLGSVAESVPSQPVATADRLDGAAASVPAAPAVVDPKRTIRLEPGEPGRVIAGSGIVLGPRGVDDDGRAGRLHTVSRGDTLWDIAAAYLGTPWVWPSVWTDNDDIANPHVIQPNDKVWITAHEMRVVTPEEAEAFVAAAEAAPIAEPTVIVEVEPVPAAADPDRPSTLEAFPVAVPGAALQNLTQGREITVSRRETMGFVSVEEMEGASSIVDSPLERTFMAQGDEVVIGLGEGDVAVGDEFTIFQVVEEVRDPESLRLLGHHVEPLGWLEVRQLTGDTSLAQIRTSYAAIARGTHIMPRRVLPRTVEMRSTPEAAEGKVVFLPSERTLMADGGYVYLNRGEFHGVEVGSELEVFEAGEIRNDRARNVDVRTPDEVIAKLVVVSVQPDSAVAFVLWSNRELAVGDSIRPTMPSVASR